MKNLLLLFFAILGLLTNLSAQRAGDLDRSFNYGRGSNYQFDFAAGANDAIFTVGLQEDGKVLILGRFTSYNGINRYRIARLNSDGSLDSSFNPGTGPDADIRSIVQQPDGKLLIGGYFSNYNGISRNCIARLNADGSLDNSFNPGTGIDNGFIYTISLQPDGKIIIGGGFNNYNGVFRKNIARLDSDGTLDNTFITGSGTNGSLYTTELQTDGKVLIGGTFNTYYGTTRNFIARLNSDGSLDNNFNPSTGANDHVSTIKIQPNGKILMGGNFRTIDGNPLVRIARLNADGSFDNSFNTITGANDIVVSIALVANGQILIGGDFTSYKGTTRNAIARINVDGSLDTNFNPATGASGYSFSNFWSCVNSIVLQSDGKIILGGGFTRYNALYTSYVARLLGSGPTSTRENLKLSLKIYPNPAASYITIEVKNPTTVQVVNSLGQVVISQAVIGTSEISTASLATGMYTVLAEGYKASILVVSK